MREPRSGRRDWFADHAIVDGFARRLPAATEEGIGGAAHADASRFCCLDDRLAIGKFHCQRFLAIGVFARFDDLQRDLRMRGWKGQVDDDIDVIARQQVVHAASGQPMFGGECPRPVFDDIGAGGDLDDIKGRAAANISRRDVARADDANV